jgi:hypothetical protein
MIAFKLAAPPKKIVSRPNRTRIVHHLVYIRPWDTSPLACGESSDEAATLAKKVGNGAVVSLLVSSGPAAFKPCPICQPTALARYTICRDLVNG